MTGEIIFASGLLDLMGVHPIEKGNVWENPWNAIGSLVADIPHHPYAHLEEAEIRASFEELLSFLQEAGLSYCRQNGANSRVIIPSGKAKVTYCVPNSMWAGVKALQTKPPCLIADFHGLSEFSAKQIVSTLQPIWPGLRAAQLAFPNAPQASELFTGEMIAQTMELAKSRAKLFTALGPHLKDAEAIGLPAILGMKNTAEIISEMEEKIGVPVFEIPTLPVSVPGLRLNNTFIEGLSAKGVKTLPQTRVLEVRPESTGGFSIVVGSKSHPVSVWAKGVVLATGRFWSRGLLAERDRIRETIFDLPVRQPPSRKQWHHSDLFDPRGHPINRAGVEIDSSFRPLDKYGKPVFDTLFAAGSILAHQDWARMKCGSGLSIVSSYAAVSSFKRLGNPQL
jgi:glycerol-3-phosphate dehydrogenase subunit B